MDITEAFIDAQIKALEARHQQLLADGNAVSGAIQAWRVALDRLREPAPDAAGEESK